jgi:formylglycine-generating enzyme required for sulfatase activity
LNFLFFDDPALFEASADALAQALQTDIAWMRRHTEFGEAARQWLALDRAAGLLLRPPMLDQAEAWIALRPAGAPQPAAETEEYLAASRKAETDGQIAAIKAKKRWRFAQAAIYGLLCSVSIGLIGWINQDYLKAQWRWFLTERPFAAANIWPYVLGAPAEASLQPKESFKECRTEQDKDYCPEMIVIPGGSFIMGSPPAERDRQENEGPQHRVTIAPPIAVSKFTVTFGQWDICVAYGDCLPVKDTGMGRGRQPAINLTWNDAQTYVRWLSKTTGKTYRLLSEAEYEFAARGNAAPPTRYPWGDDVQLAGKAMANCDGCGSQWDDKRPAPVGQFAPNNFGLYDMAGNVAAWIEDCFHNNYDRAPADASPWLDADSDFCRARGIRGGSWTHPPEALRSAARGWFSLDNRSVNLGFRVARTLGAP